MYSTSTIKNQSETEITEGKYSQYFFKLLGIGIISILQMENTRGFLKATETGVISILRYKTDTIRYLC